MGNLFCGSSLFKEEEKFLKGVAMDILLGAAKFGRRGEIWKQKSSSNPFQAEIVTKTKDRKRLKGCRIIKRAR